MKIKGISALSGTVVEISIDRNSIQNVVEIKEPVKDLPYVAPGFLDMQVNGYNGSDYSLADLSAHHIVNIITSLAASGTTQHVPTFVSMPEERFLRNLRITAQAIRNSPRVAAAIPGLHIEGPFISSEDGPRGAHDRKFIRNPNFEEFTAWQDAAEGNIAYVTVAPELDGSIDFIRQVVTSGVKVAIGHTGAEPEQIQQAIKAGASLSTHLGNGSYTTIPRLKNYIWEQLSSDELMAGCISDGFHLPKSVVRVFSRAKGLERMILVSDVALLGGYAPGQYKWGDLDVEVFPDGHLGLPGTTILAGAAHLLDWDIVRFMEFTGHSLPETMRLCTINPATYLGVENQLYGKLTAGAPANLFLYRYAPGDDRLRIEKTWIAGELVYPQTSSFD